MILSKISDKPHSRQPIFGNLKAKSLIMLLAACQLFLSLPIIAKSDALAAGNDRKPEIITPKVKDLGKIRLSAYTSEVAQCDASPCITANGFNVCKHGIEDTVAANFLPFGAKVRIPDLYGDRIFIVRDRMNKRFNNTIDIWMVDKADAINFGVQTARVELVE